MKIGRGKKDTKVVKKKLKILIILSLFCLTNTAIVFSKEIKFYHIKSTTIGENASISSNCKGDSTSSYIECDFNQIMVTYKLDPEDLNKTKQEIITYLNRADELKIATKELLDECNKIQHNTENIKPSLFKFCENPTIYNLKNFLMETAEEEAKTCKIISQDVRSIKFHKISQYKWIAKTEPRGLCNFTYLYEMETDPQNPYVLWRWSEVRLNGDKSSELCKDFKLNSKVVYSSFVQDRHATEINSHMQCGKIVFGD